MSLFWLVFHGILFAVLAVLAARWVWGKIQSWLTPGL